MSAARALFVRVLVPLGLTGLLGLPHCSGGACSGETFSAKLEGLNAQCCSSTTCQGGPAPTVCGSPGCAAHLAAMRSGACQQHFDALLNSDGAAALSTAVAALQDSCMRLHPDALSVPPAVPPQLPPHPDCIDSLVYRTAFGGMIVGCEIYSDDILDCPNAAKSACPVSCGTGCAAEWNDCTAADLAGIQLCLNGGVCANAPGVGAFECSCPTGYCGFQCEQPVSLSELLPDGSCPCADDPDWRVGPSSSLAAAELDGGCELFYGALDTDSNTVSPDCVVRPSFP
eukprot:COSAG02_NODE_154_length_33067_cov_38.282092_11_plen_285_part_00